jgi:epoxyqueuosine reductase QueG
MLYHTALPSLYSSTELPTRIPAPLRRLEIGSGGSKELAAASRSHRAVELSRRATLQQWSGPPTVAVTNLSFAVAMSHSYLATVANAGIGWRGRVLSCNSNLRVPCIGFESILLGCTIL